MDKRKKRYLIFSIIAVILSFSIIYVFTQRKNKIYLIENTSSEIFEPDVSTFYFPVYLAVKDLQELINRKVKVNIINKHLPIKDGKDTIILKIERLDDIDLKLSNGNFNLKVPLKLQVAFLKNVGLSKNMPFFKKKPVTIKLEAHFRSEVFLQEDMSLRTKTKLTKIEWIEQPTVSLLGIEFDIKRRAESVLDENAVKITKMIDDMIRQKVNLNKPVNRIWGKMQKSLPATKHQKNLFVKIQPQKVAVYIDKNNSDSLKLDLKVTSKIYVRFGDDTNQIQRTKFPSKIEILTVPNKPVMDKIQIHALLLLREINKTLNEKLVGQSLEIPNFNIRIAKIRVYNGIKNVAIQIDLKGALQGTVFVKGRPVLSGDKSKFYVKDLDFESRLQDELFNSFADVLHAQLRDILNENLKFDLTDIFSGVTELAQRSIDTTKMAKKADFDIQQLVIDKLDIHLTQNSIQLIIFGKSNFEISVKKEGLKFKKPGVAVKPKTK